MLQGPPLPQREDDLRQPRRSLGIAHAVKLCEGFVGDEKLVTYLRDQILQKGTKHYVDKFAREVRRPRLWRRALNFSLRAIADRSLKDLKGTVTRVWTELRYVDFVL